MKKHVNAFQYAQTILETMPKGLLVTTKVGENVNTMTIGWGTLGIEWGKQIFVAYIRDSRYTRELLDKAGEFTVNIPLGDVPKDILALCGTKSGRDINKIQSLGLTLEDSEIVSAPGIRELPLTLECKVLFRNVQDESCLPEAIQNRYYSAINAKDYHIVYYGHIVNAYIITD